MRGLGYFLHRRGFTLVEMLVASVILVIVTGIAGTFLVQNLVYTQRTQARNEMQVNLRSAMEMVTADLFNAGSSGVGVPCTWSGKSLVIEPAAPHRDRIAELRYCSPYGDGPVSTSYSIAEIDGLSVLLRGGLPAAPGVVALEFDVECASGVPCTSDVGGEVVFVTVRMLARTVQPMRNTTPSGFTFGETSIAQLVDAGIVSDGFMYEASERRVVLPNLGR